MPDMHDKAEEIRKQGLKYAQCGLDEEALLAYNRSLQLDSSNPKTFHNRGHWFLMRRDYSNAVQDFSQAITLNPNQHESWFARGRSFSIQHKYQEAIDDYNEAIRLCPLNSTYHASRALTYSLMEEYDRASEDADQAIRLNPKEYDAYYIRGRVSQLRAVVTNSTREWEQSISSYTSYLQGCSKDRYTVLLSRSASYLAIGAHADALADASAAIELDPQHPDAYYSRGRTFFEAKEHGKALSDIRQALALHSTFPDCHYILGSCHFHLGKFKEAKKHLTAYLRLVGPDPRALEERARVYEALGEANKATNDLKQAQRLRQQQNT